MTGAVYLTAQVFSLQYSYNDEMDETLCSNCRATIQAIWFFCPNCGKVLKEKPISVSIGKQILVYVVSFFFAPLGLMWGVKYVRNSNTKTKIIGLISIILTFLALGLTLYTFSSVMGRYSIMLNNLGNGRYVPF